MKEDDMIAIGVRAVASDQQAEKSPLDAAWLVLEAANDLGDDETVEACRRVIDANLNGAPAVEADLRLVAGYFR